MERNYESTEENRFLLMCSYPILRYLGISLQKTDRQKHFSQRSRLLSQNTSADLNYMPNQVNGLRNSTMSLRQDNQFSGRNTNPVPSLPGQ
jgi:hypothetical protein